MTARLVLLWVLLSVVCVVFVLGVCAVWGALVTTAGGPPGFLVLEWSEHLETWEEGVAIRTLDLTFDGEDLTSRCVFVMGGLGPWGIFAIRGLVSLGVLTKPAG